MILFVFFELCGDHRYLPVLTHSFPTRRSSDLSTRRGHLLRRFGDLIADNADRLARIEVRDNGKLYAEMKRQVEYIPQYFYYQAGLADKIEGTVIPIDKADAFNFTRHEPLGVCVAITAWNSPHLLAAW